MTLAQWFRAADTGNAEFIEENQRFAASRDPQGNTALMHAALQGNAGLIPLLESELGLQNNEHRTALMLAVFSPKALLLIPGLLQEARLHDAAGQTALMIAAQRGDAETVRELRDFESCEKDNKGRTALMHAAAHSNPACVELLVQAEKCAEDTNKMTALMFAAGAGDFESCKLLKEFESAYKNVKGETAEDIAVMKGYQKIAILLHEQEETDLIRHKDPENLVNGEEETELLEKEYKNAVSERKAYENIEQNMEENDELNELSVKIMALNSKVQQIETENQELQSNQSGSFYEGKFNIYDRKLTECQELITQNEQNYFDELDKVRKQIQETVYSHAELQNSYDELNDELLLINKQNVLIKQRIDALENEKTENLKDEVDINEELIEKCNKIDILQNTIELQNKEIESLVARIDKLESGENKPLEPSSNEKGMSEDIDFPEIEKELQLNMDIMQEIMERSEEMQPQQILEQFAELKVQVVELQHQLYILESNSYDARIEAVENCVRVLQEQLYGPFAKSDIE